LFDKKASERFSSKAGFFSPGPRPAGPSLPEALLPTPGRTQEAALVLRSTGDLSIAFSAIWNFRPGQWSSPDQILFSHGSLFFAKNSRVSVKKQLFFPRQINFLN
jgi:hypothetical protein